jgi:hypothetical protein
MMDVLALRPHQRCWDVDHCTRRKLAGHGVANVKLHLTITPNSLHLGLHHGHKRGHRLSLLDGLRWNRVAARLPAHYRIAGTAYRPAPETAACSPLSSHPPPEWSACLLRLQLLCAPPRLPWRAAALPAWWRGCPPASEWPRPAAQTDTDAGVC